MTNTGMCPFCGQIIGLPHEMSDAEATEFAALNCDCPASERRRDSERFFEKAKTELERVLGFDLISEAEGTPEEKLFSSLVNLLPNVISGEVTAVSVTAPKIGKINIKSTALGSVKIKKEVKLGIEGVV